MAKVKVREGTYEDAVKEIVSLRAEVAQLSADVALRDIEIERLRAALREREAALKAIAELPEEEYPDDVNPVQTIRGYARAALGGTLHKDAESTTNERLRDALSYYANSNKFDWVNDHGERARAALGDQLVDTNKVMGDGS